MSDFKLWYSTPATDWSQGLPLGNGRIGAVVIAAPYREVWNMTEVTYWSGQAESEPAPMGGTATLEEMRNHFFAGDYNEGDRLAKQHLQPKKRNFGTNLSLCEVVIDFAEQDVDSGAKEAIERELDLTCAVARTVVQSKESTLHREIFASHADDLVVSKIWSDEPGGILYDRSEGWFRVVYG